MLTVFISIAVMLLYQIPASQARLDEYARARAVAQAADLAGSIAGKDRQQWNSDLESSVGTGDGEALLVNRNAHVIARDGSSSLHPIPGPVLQTAAEGNRMSGQIGGAQVAVVPLTYQGRVSGGVIFVTGKSEKTSYQIYLRSAIEAALVSSVIGGGLMLLIAILLGRRIARLVRGARAIERGDFSYRIQLRRKDELGNLAEAFNAMSDQIERSFSRIEESNETLSTILDNLNEGVLATDLEMRNIFANPVARSMLGVDPDETLKTLPDPWEDFSLPEAVSRCANQQECDEASVQDEQTFLRINLEHMPHFDDHKGGVLVVIQDLSEGRELEANQQRFLANAAHELKTPITTILGAADLLLTGDEEDPTIQRRFLKHIQRESERMSRLSETLLRLARSGFSSHDPNLEDVDLQSVAQTVIERMEPLAQSADIKLSLEGRATRVRADPEWLEQALLVALNNAVQHSDRGGRIRLRMDDSAIEIVDEGAGISKSDLPYIFERFYRGTRDSGGFGLGLPICKDLVEKMEGRISVSSREGAGTVIRIELLEAKVNA